MSTNTLDSIKHRVSANAFDPSKPLSKAEIEELVSYALEAPSSFDIQHTRFIAVVDQAQKEKLKALSWNQAKVADAAVTFIILGDTLGHEKLPDLLARAVKAGVFEQGVADYLVNGAAGFYSNYGNTQLVRDEVIRSASFAAMNLMLAADAKGLVSGPMIGFDSAGVQKAFNIPERYVPVMTLAVGYAKEAGNWPRKPRLTVAETLAYDEGKTF
ncbi:MAG: nitroreductase family protein [Pseudomonadota bacterium]